MNNQITDEKYVNLLAAIVNSSDDAIYALSLEGIILTWNKGAELIYGFTPEEIIGKHIFIFVPEDRHLEATKFLQEINQGKHINHLWTVRKHKYGHKFTVSMTICPIYNSAGEITAISTTARKLTAQEMAEPKFKTLFESSPEALIIIDITGKISIVNGQTEKFFGYTREEMINQDVALLIPKRFIDKHIHYRQNYFSKLNIRNIGGTGTTLLGQRKNGTEFPVEIALSPLTTNEGTLIIATIRDITERKKDEKKIHELNKKLIIAAKEAGMAEVASSIIHNIGNVLNSMQVSSDVIYRSYESLSFKTLFEALTLLEHNSNDIALYLQKDFKGKLIPHLLTSLLNPLLNDYEETLKEISNISEGIKSISEIIVAQQSLATTNGMTEKILLKDLIQLSLQIFATQLESHNIKITIDHEDLSILYIDKIKVSQIFFNLMQNSIDALICDPDIHKQKEINIYIKKYSGNQNKFSLIIHDNGPGLDVKILDKMFAYGFTTKENGHGIGLYSCNIYAKELGGTIKVHSNGLGHGTSFILELPME